MHWTQHTALILAWCTSIFIHLTSNLHVSLAYLFSWPINLNINVVTNVLYAGSWILIYSGVDEEARAIVLFVFRELETTNHGERLLRSLLPNGVNKADKLLLRWEGSSNLLSVVVGRCSTSVKIDERFLLSELGQSLLWISDSFSLSWEELAALTLSATQWNSLLWLWPDHSCSWSSSSSGMNISWDPLIPILIMIFSSNDWVFIISLVLDLSISSKAFSCVVACFSVHSLKFFSLMLSQVQSGTWNKSFRITFDIKGGVTHVCLIQPSLSQERKPAPSLGHLRLIGLFSFHHNLIGW